ncbi:MAG: YifB family Mg chelatase-like AAA ATPase [Alphaproteobacteria bacterium]|nr:YifB family Mg chelatase-like AAA ATPase [Alphaproteobacteria bacterium]
MSEIRDGNKLSRVRTVAFNGLDATDVELQVQISSGMPTFTIVGLPDKTIAESRERIRAAFCSLGLKLPPKRITVNLAPADTLKEGSHYDLPLALGILAVDGVIPQDKLRDFIVVGELGLDGSVVKVNGVLLAAVKAANESSGLICPAAQGAEAAWSEAKTIIPIRSLGELIDFFNGNIFVPRPQALFDDEFYHSTLDMQDVKGQESAKRALEIAAAGAHNMVMVGPPGAGKSMLAARLPTILPKMSRNEALEVSMVASVAGEIKSDRLCFERPFRAPHHSASTPSIIGGGRPARPGELSLAHNGVLFLDELPEFTRTTLEALRQPLETGVVNISRVYSHIQFPAKIQLVAAMNPCRCGYLGDPARACPRSPRCASEYQAKISGPLLDRIDIHIEVPPVSLWDKDSSRSGDSSAVVRKRVEAARKIQRQRFLDFGREDLYTNSELNGDLLEKATVLENDAKELLISYANKMKLSARGYNRTLKLARTIADLNNSEKIIGKYIGEALSLRWKVPDYKN